MPRLSENQRNQAIGMLRAGALHIAVAQHFGCSRQAIHNLATRYANTGSVRDRPRPGQRRVTSRRDDRAIMLTLLRNRFKPATLTARQHRVSHQTIGRCLLQRNDPIRARRPYTGPILTARHRAARLAWARRYRRWTRNQWNDVVFSDESRFRVSHADGRVRVYRRRNE